MTKKYTNQQYTTFLNQPFNNNFGIDFDTVWNDVSNGYSFKTIMNDYGISASYFKNNCIPIIKSILGENAIFMYLMIMNEEPHPVNGGAFDFINWTYRENATKDARDTSNHIKDLLKSTAYPPAVTAPEVGGKINNSSWAQSTLNNAPFGSIARYYIPSTLAGNAWVCDPSWSSTQYFGNPYDSIIDYIKSKGKDPFGGSTNVGSGGTGSGSSPIGGNGIDLSELPTDAETLQAMLLDAINQGTQALMELLDKLFPKKVYLNNSKFHVLGMDFKRYGQWLFIKYPWDNLPDLTTDIDYNDKFTGSEGGESGNPNENPSDWYAKIVAELDKIRNKSFWYSNARPAGNLTSINYTDCSGFAGWIARTAFPAMFNSGYTNTGTQLTTMKSVGTIVYSGSQSGLVSQQDKVKAGDFLIMGSEPSCGAGLQSHIAWVETPEKVWSMEGSGLLCKSLNTFLTQWWTPPRPYFNVCRPK